MLPLPQGIFDAVEICPPQRMDIRKAVQAGHPHRMGILDGVKICPPQRMWNFSAVKTAPLHLLPVLNKHFTTKPQSPARAGQGLESAGKAWEANSLKTAVRTLNPSAAVDCCLTFRISNPRH